MSIWFLLKVVPVESNRTGFVMIEKRLASWKSKKYYRGFSTIVVGCSLIEAATSEVIGNDHIRNSVKDELDVLCVGSTSHVTVNLFGCGLILGLKLGLNVCSSLSVLLSPCKKNEYNFLSSRITPPPEITVPVYSGKQIVSGDLRIFSSNRSFLFKKRMMEVSPNHLLLQMESNNFRLSCIRFWKVKN